MEQKIKEVQEYFISKILNEKFETGFIGDCTCEVTVDKKYTFTIWTENDIVCRKPYHGIGGYFMKLEFTPDQKVKCDSIFLKIIKEYKDTVLLAEKKKQLAKLKRELGEI